MDKEKTFALIKERYKEYDLELKQQGKGVVFDTEFGIFGATDLDVIFEFFKQIDLKKFKDFVDLGSGDGRVVLVASLFTRSAGIEADTELCEASKQIAKELDLDVEFICNDFLDTYLVEYDCLFINPDKSFHRGTEAKLIGDMDSDVTLFVYNIAFKPETLKKGKTYWIENIPITKYTNE